MKIEFDIVDGLILKFCKLVEIFYGKDVIILNMYLYNYLKEVIFDYGLVISFWCFSFERFNGILGSIIINKRFIEF